MSKKISFSLIILSVLLSLFIYVPVNAQGPSGDWSTGISCLNQDTEHATNITLGFYSEDTGTLVLTYDDTIAAGMSKNYYSSSFAGLGSDFVGSLMVSSSAPLTCAADQSKSATGTQGDPFRFSAAKGFAASEAAPVVFVSQIEKAFYNWNSYIAIQNTTSEAVDVTVTYVDRYGTAYPAATENLVIPGNGNHVVYLEENSEIPDDFLGGVKIAADDGTTPLAVVATFYNVGTDYETSQIHAYNGAVAGASTLYAPYLVRNYYGYNSGLVVQNVGNTNTSFKITFTFADVDYVYQHDVNLLPGEVKDFYLPNIAEIDAVDSLAVSQRFGKAVIEAVDTAGDPSGGLLAGNINQDNRGGDGIPEERWGQGATYGAFLSTGASDKYFISKWMKNDGSFSSGFNISNFTETNGSCNISFVDDVDANYSVDVDANSFYSIYAPNVSNLDDGYNAGVLIECTVDVFVITNASANPGSGFYGDSFYQMNAGTD